MRQALKRYGREVAMAEGNPIAVLEAQATRCAIDFPIGSIVRYLDPPRPYEHLSGMTFLVVGGRGPRVLVKCCANQAMQIGSRWGSYGKTQWGAPYWCPGAEPIRIKHNELLGVEYAFDPDVLMRVG